MGYFYWFKRSLIHAISTTNHIDVSTIVHGYCMIVARLSQVLDFCPFIFGYIIYFTLFWSVIWILWSNRVNEIFCLVIKFAVKVSQLMPTSRVNHWCSLYYFIFLFIYYETFIRKYWTNIIFFFLPSNKKYLILGLNWTGILRHNLGISYRNLNSSLCI